MQDLNKNQLILLTLLVSFVTSIGTGIITTALLQEAPTSVTQVINRVVERTIEQVTPASSGGGTKTTENKVTTVVVKEEDQVIEAISKNQKSIIRIKENNIIDGSDPFYGIGLLLSKDGLVVSAKKAINNPNSAIPASFTATFPDGTQFAMTIIGSNDEEGLTFFKVQKDAKQTLPAEPAVLSATNAQLGQSVIALDGEVKNNISIGRIISVDQNAQNAKEIRIIQTDIAAKPVVLGAPALNLSGEIIGLRTTLGETAQSFITAAVIKRVMKDYPVR